MLLLHSKSVWTSSAICTKQNKQTKWKQTDEWNKNKTKKQTKRKERKNKQSNETKTKP